MPANHKVAVCFLNCVRNNFAQIQSTVHAWIFKHCMQPCSTLQTLDTDPLLGTQSNEPHALKHKHTDGHSLFTWSHT